MDSVWRDAYALACLLHALIQLCSACADPPAGCQKTSRAVAPWSQHSKADCACAGHEQDVQQEVCADSNCQLACAASQPSLLIGEQLQGNAAQDWGEAHANGQRGRLQDLQACKAAGRCTLDEPISAGSAGELQARQQGASSGTSIAKTTAMRELDLAIMMGGHTFQSSLHAAMAIAGDAWPWRREEGRLEHRQAKYCTHRDVSMEQTSKRERSEHEERPNDSQHSKIIDSSCCPSSNDSQKRHSPVSMTGSKAAATWAFAQYDEEELFQQLPPGDEHL